MPTLTKDKVQLSVRVSEHVAQLLDAQVDQARLSGRKMTKEQLVSDAIITAYSGQDFSLPTHDAAWTAAVDPRSNTALLDLLDDLESDEKNR